MKGEPMQYLYPAVFKLLDDGSYYIRVPDLPGCQTEGVDLKDAYQMVQDAVAMWICDSEDNHESIPDATGIHDVIHNDPDFVSLVAVDTTLYRISIDNRCVKKTLTLPAWLNRKAEEQGVNFSQLLQSALKEQLHINTH
jgi:antitoxin HicB